MVFGTNFDKLQNICRSKINSKTTQLEESCSYEKPCFCLLKSMIFSGQLLLISQ